MTVSEALDVARTYVADLSREQEQDLVLLEDQTRRYPAGWVFFYNSRAFAETGTLRKQLIGTPPFLVAAETGAVHRMGTAHGVAHYLDLYAQHGTCHPERTPSSDSGPA